MMITVQLERLADIKLVRLGSIIAITKILLDFNLVFAKVDHQAAKFNFQHKFPTIQ